MDGFLVLARCQVDDIPMALYPDRRTAELFAQVVTCAEVCARASAVFKLDTSIVDGIDVVQFLEGRPLGFERIKTFQE